MPGEHGERTEAPTPKRRQEARGRGQVARSQELPAAAVLLAGLIGLQLLGPGLWKKLQQVMRHGLSAEQVPDAGGLGAFAGAEARQMMLAMLPLMVVVFVAALVTLYWQVGVLFTWHPVMPTLNKLNPITGVQRLFSARTAVTAVLNIGKLLLLVGVAYGTIADVMNVIVFAANLEHVPLYTMVAQMLLRLGMRLAVVMFLLALADYAYQRYRHEKDLRMSKEEIREELKHMEGDPMIKRRRREIQMKLALQRIRREVPKADVIVTNPTHFAVALRYTPGEMAAPKVVAKGADLMAQRIRQVAALHGVPIVERPALARMIYAAVDVGQEIPERFYEAVAEVLAYVYELTGRKLGPKPIPA
jgi:flagellar biosynthetic protein FlhB